METKTYDARRKAILTDMSLSIEQEEDALKALDAEATLTDAQLDRIDAAQRATEAEQARLDKAL